MIYKANNTIVNRLVGTTSFRICKVWNPRIDAEASIQVQFFQNGTPYIPPEKWPEGVSEANGILTLTGTGNFCKTFTGLSRYDGEGAEYAYTVEEVNESIQVGDQIYKFNDMLYSVEGEDRVRTATITNVSGDGDGLTFDVNKVWLDDGDASRRVPISVGLYYIDPQTKMTTQVESWENLLTAENQWYSQIHYKPDGNRTDNADIWLYDNYTVREESNDWLKVERPVVDYPFQDKSYVYTNDLPYEHWVEKEGNSAYTLYNRRVGTLNITVEKTWAVGDMSGLTATFQLYANGEKKGDPLSLAQPACEITFKKLRKYDDKGAIIPYQVKEVSIQQAEGQAVEFQGGKATVDGFPILSSVTPGLYKIGEHYRTNDQMTYAFANTRADQAELAVNKVWRDGGKDDPTRKRPDISLALFRTSENPAGPKTRERVSVPSDRIWNTEHNDWFWTCHFGSLPRYDEDGYEYQYTVEERIVQSSSEYGATYYNGDVQPNAAGNDTRVTFAEIGSASSASAGFVNADGSYQAGTIINTRQSTRALTGRKLWLNLPAWFNKKDLPTVYIQLYRTLDTAAFDDEHKVNDARAELVDGKSTFTFKDMPGYDQWGQKYLYYLQEQNEDGSKFSMPGYVVSSDPTSADVTNTYNLNSPRVEIMVQKTWDWSKDQYGHTIYPAVTFELWQKWSNGKSLHDVKVNECTFGGGEIADWKAADNHTFTKDSGDNYLLRYAPDGTAFQYYVKEVTKLDGYETTPSASIDISFGGEQSGDTY